MKSDFLLAITQLSAEKNLPKDVVLTAVESALVSAYKKEHFTPTQNIAVKINPNTGMVEVWAEKTVVQKVADRRAEITLSEAKKVKKDIKLGETVMVEATPPNAGRIAAQTAKQVILQRLHEAEHSAIIEEYQGHEGSLVSGTVQRLEPRQVFIDLGRVEAALPITEQVPGERYRIGQRVKVVILEVAKTPKGPRVTVSRSHPDLVRRLFEMEVPEIRNGVVEVKSIARESGSRSKVAVAAKQEGVDPVGCCVGLRGIRIQNIVSELSGEKIDVVAWSAELGTFVANALSPAQILSVAVNRTDGSATVVVPDRQLSLAIGKEGQNVRLAAKLTGARIDIKAASAVEAERAAVEAAKAAAEAARKAEAAEMAALEEEIKKEEEATAAPEPVEAGVAAPAEQPVEKPPFVMPVPLTPAAGTLRFAEDIMSRGGGKGSQKKRMKKKGSGSGGTKESEEEAARRAARRGAVPTATEEDEDV